MPVTLIDVSHLQIVGYANVLPASGRPSIVPPIFRRKDNSDSIWMPPYSFNNGCYLCDATEISNSELHSLEYRQEVTLFDTPLDAQKECELWVDLQGKFHYEKRGAARRCLNEIARQEVRSALEDFKYSQLDDAVRHSSVALLANEQELDAKAIKIAISEVRGNADLRNLFYKLIPPHHLEAVRSRVRDLSKQYYANGKSVPPTRRSPMYGIATIQPRAA